MSDDLSAKGVLEIQAILRNAKEVTRDIALLREGLNETSAAGDKLEKKSRTVEVGLERVSKSATGAATANQGMTGTLKQSTAAWDKQNKIYDDYLNHQSKAAQAGDQQTASLIAQRYALYDVATTYGIISAALLASGGYAVKVGADFESAFTNVQRTSEGTVAQIQAIRDGLVDLSTQIPLTFQDLSKIAALGNQLGIASQNILAFTETIARFAAIAGLSADQVADSFGKISNLTGLDPTQYENLGSAIAYVARTSAATESTILSTSKEIAAIADGAGFSADAIVGLAGALASLSIPPERARGALSIYFSALNTAVSEGGDKLTNFATVVGVTREELTRLVNDNEGQKILQGFVAGIGDLNNVAKTQALDALGLSAVRVDQTFRALSSNTQLVTDSFAGSAAAMSSGTELARQYAQVVDDLNSQWMIFVNSVNALVEEISGGAVPGLAALFSQLTLVVNAMRGFFGNEDAQRVAVFVGVLTAALGIFFAYRSVVALATASTYALTTAQAGLAASGTVGGIRGLITATLGLRTASATAAVATRSAAVGAEALGVGATVGSAGVARLRSALLLLGRATIIIGVLQVATDLLLDFNGTMKGLIPTAGFLIDASSNIATSIYGVGIAINQVLGAIPGLGAGFQQTAKLLQGYSKNATNFANNLKAGFTNWANGLPTDEVAALSGEVGKIPAGVDAGTQAFDDMADSAGGAAAQVRTLVDYGNDLSTVFKRAFDIQFSGGQGLDKITSGWSSIRQSIEDTNQQIDDYRATMLSLTSDRAIKEYWLSVAENYGDVLRAGELRGELADLDNDLNKTTKNLTKAQDKNSKTLDGNSDAAISNRAEILGLVTNYQGYIAALASSGLTQDQLRDKTTQLKADFIAQATQLGYNQTELQQYASSFDAVTTAINNVPRDITVDFNGDPALQAINEFMAQAQAAIGGGVSVPVVVDDSALLKYARGVAIIAQINSAQAIAANINEPASRRVLYSDRAVSLSALYNSGQYYDGGYTGDGGKYEPKGVVHGGEFVFSKKATQNIGVANLAFAHNMAKRGYSGGGSVGGSGAPVPTGPGIVQLSAADRQLLVDVRRSIDDKPILTPTAIAVSTGAVNTNESNRRTA